MFGLKKLSQIADKKKSMKNVKPSSKLLITSARQIRKKPEMINSLSKEDYSFYYENSVWD